jgi:hypothetical protein
LRQNFDYLEEHVSFYRQLEKKTNEAKEARDAIGFCSLRLKWFADFHEFVFPKRRPEDSSGKPLEASLPDESLLRQFASLLEHK